jgi:antitoxin component YwqK of YwqJK toxin-antitoxin module
VHARLRLCGLALCSVLAACGPDVRELHYPSGALFERAEWDGALRHGPRSNFFESGAREREVWYAHGLPDGEWRAWNEAGVLLSIGKYEAGRRTGEWTLNFAGDKDGVWLYWRPDGSPDVEETWRAGTLLGARELAASSR